MIKFLDLQKINAQYADELKQVASEVNDIKQKAGLQAGQTS
jgi:hypothetical protein